MGTKFHQRVGPVPHSSAENRRTAVHIRSLRLDRFNEPFRRRAPSIPAIARAVRRVTRLKEKQPEK